jgi:hypothetical protein
VRCRLGGAHLVTAGIPLALNVVGLILFVGSLNQPASAAYFIAGFGIGLFGLIQTLIQIPNPKIAKIAMLKELLIFDAVLEGINLAGALYSLDSILQ